MTRAVLNKLENDGRVLLPSGEGTHDKQVSVFEDRPEPHPAWVSGELIAVFRTLVVTDRPYNLQLRISGSEMQALASVAIGCEKQTYPL